MSFRTRVIALRASGEFFDADRPVSVARAPGRIDLMGGNADYTGGQVLLATTREATWAAVQLRADTSVVLFNPQMRERGWAYRVEFRAEDFSSEDALRRSANRSPKTRWTAYVAGVFYLLRKKNPAAVACGATVFIESNIPVNKGVSSSAAIAVAVMKAASSAYGSVLEGIELAECCQWVENTIAESPCGIMDQAVVVLGEEGRLLPLLCQPCLAQPPVELPEALEYRAVDCGVSHSVAGPECETARAAAFMGYKLICDQEQLEVEPDNTGSIPRWTDERWRGYLSNVDPLQFRSHYEQRLPEEMTGAEYLRTAGVHVDTVTPVRPKARYRVRAASRYAVEEHRRNRLFIDLACQASTNSEFELMGDLMYQSHAAYTECGLGCDATDAIVEFVRNAGPALGLYGARITGGGAGGTVAVLSRRGAREAFDRAVSRYAERSGFAPHVFEGSSPGADRFGIETM